MPTVDGFNCRFQPCRLTLNLVIPLYRVMFLLEAQPLPDGGFLSRQPLLVSWPWQPLTIQSTEACASPALVEPVNCEHFVQWCIEGKSESLQISVAANSATSLAIKPAVAAAIGVFGPIGLLVKLPIQLWSLYNTYKASR